MAKIYALSTIDNPYNPFNEFDSWYDFDMSKNYATAQLLARALEPFIIEGMTEGEIQRETRRVILDLIRFDTTDNLCLVTEEDDEEYEE